MRKRRRVWFRPALIHGFDAVDWRGPAFVAAMATVGLSALLLALTAVADHPALAGASAAVAIATAILGVGICARHIGGDEAAPALAPGGAGPDIGVCEGCSRSFPYRLVHSGFSNCAYAYCARCGTTALLSGWRDPPAGAAVAIYQPIAPALEPFLAPCPCGGRFRAGAAPRCPACATPLSAERAAAWIEADAPGSARGWRWQRSWTGLYAIVIDGRLVDDPWRPDLPPPPA